MTLLALNLENCLAWGPQEDPSASVIDVVAHLAPSPLMALVGGSLADVATLGCTGSACPSADDGAAFDGAAILI